MPNRIIKESTFLSENIAALTDFEFRLWVGLITYVDDAGRGDARPAVIKGRVFPLRGRVSEKDIDAALHGLAAKGCVSLYTVGGKPYFWFPTWSKHQRVRDCKPKYPSPEEADHFDGSPQSAATCGNSPQPAAHCGYNPIQSESNPNPNPNTKESAHGRFTPPTVEEVRAYCQERKNSVDPEKFVDFYAAADWMRGKTKITDWRACVRTWEKRETESGTNGKKSPPAGRGKAPAAETMKAQQEAIRRMQTMLATQSGGGEP